MRTLNFFGLVIVGLLASMASQAAPVKPFYQDIKLPNQRVLEYQKILAPAAAGTTQILNASNGPTSAAAATVTTFVAQPDVPRNIVITPGTSTVDVAACVITVSGTDILGHSISETFTFTNNQSSAVTGNKAFNTISSVAFPANCEDGSFAAKWSIGYGEKLGLRRCMDQAGHFIFSTVGGAYESTRATVAADASVVSLNTADFNGTMNGSSNFEAFFVQNFRCF